MLQDALLLKVDHCLLVQVVIEFLEAQQAFKAYSTVAEL